MLFLQHDLTATNALQPALQSLEGAFSSVLNAAMRMDVDLDDLDLSDPNDVAKLSMPDEMVDSVDLALVLGQLDQFRGTAAAAALDR